MEHQQQNDRSKRTVDFLLLVGRMKTNKRTGWVNSGVNLPESIADHSYRLSVAALLAAPYCNASPEKAALIGLAHDLAECITGDIVPHDPMGKEAKQQLEKSAMERLQDVISPHFQESLFQTLWKEYEDQITNEGRLCKDIDKFEMALQAYEYELSQPKLNLSGFFESVKDKIKSTEVKSWLNELMRRRSAFRNDEFPVLVKSQSRDIFGGSFERPNSAFLSGVLVGTFIGVYFTRLYL